MPRGIGLDFAPDERGRRLAEASCLAHEEAAALDADIVHDHTDYVPDPGYPIPIIRTIHGPAVDYAVRLVRAQSRHGDRFVAISNRHRDLFEWAAADRFGPGGQIAFRGRLQSPRRRGGPLLPRRR